MTILDACVRVLQQKNENMTADQIYEEIRRQNLYEFNSKDPLGVLRSTIRKHIRSQNNPRVKEIARGLYRPS